MDGGGGVADSGKVLNLRSWIVGYVLGLTGQQLPVIATGPMTQRPRLISHDGYALQDVNGTYLIPKEDANNG